MFCCIRHGLLLTLICNISTCYQHFNMFIKYFKLNSSAYIIHLHHVLVKCWVKCKFFKFSSPCDYKDSQTIYKAPDALYICDHMLTFTGNRYRHYNSSLRTICCGGSLISRYSSGSPRGHADKVIAVITAVSRLQRQLRGIVLRYQLGVS